MLHKKAARAGLHRARRCLGQPPRRRRGVQRRQVHHGAQQRARLTAQLRSGARRLRLPGPRLCIGSGGLCGRREKHNAPSKYQLSSNGAQGWRLE